MSPGKKLRYFEILQQNESMNPVSFMPSKGRKLYVIDMVYAALFPCKIDLNFAL